MKINRPITFCAVLISVLFTACGEQDETIDPAYTLKRNPDEKNLIALNEIQSMFKAITKGENNAKGISKGMLDSVGSLLSVEQPVIVNVKDSVAKLFDPDLQPCPLPEKILKKLKKYKGNNQAWVPKDLVSHLNGMPDKALLFQGRDVTLLLHTIKVKHSDNSADTVVIIGSPTFKNLLVSDYIVGGMNNFAYTLDCSGLLSASIEGTATVPGADITSKAGAAVDQQKSMFIGGGVVLSPLYAAYYGAPSGITLTKELRSQILTSIIEMPEVTENDILELIMSYEVIWASSKGEQGFNGSSDLSSRGSVGVGIAQVAGTANVSGTVSRRSNFASFETYLTGRQRLNSPGNVTVAAIKAKIAELNAK